MSSEDEQTIRYEPYAATRRRTPHRRPIQASDSDSEEEDDLRDREQRRQIESHIARKRRAKGAEFGYVSTVDEEGREFEVPCCTLCDKSWCDTLTCKRNPIKKCTSCNLTFSGLENEWVLEVGDAYWQRNRRCRTEQPPSVGIVDPRARYGGRSRKRTKRKKRRKTKKKTRRKKRRKKRRRKSRRKRSHLG